jgi:hypothetical protein
MYGVDEGRSVHNDIEQLEVIFKQMFDAFGNDAVIVRYQEPRTLYR